MNNRLRPERFESERFESRMPLLRTAAPIDKEFGLDEDAGPDEPDIALDHTDEEDPRGFRPFRAAALWVGMAVLGAALALAWRLWSDSQRWLAAAPAASPSGTSPVGKQLGHIAGDLDALKKNIDELRAAQHQTAANVTSLQAGQQELQRRVSSSQAARWYSNFDVLTYPTATARKSTAAPKQTPTARVPSEARSASAGRRDDGLVPPRP